jgi:hypothetical protein
MVAHSLAHLENTRVIPQSGASVANKALRGTKATERFAALNSVHIVGLVDTFGLVGCDHVKRSAELLLGEGDVLVAECALAGLQLLDQLGKTAAVVPKV